MGAESEGHLRGAAFGDKTLKVSSLEGLVAWLWSLGWMVEVLNSSDYLLKL